MKDDVKKWMKEDGQKFLMELGIKKNQTVLDFGCGEGHYSIPAAKVVGEDGKVYSLDKDEDALEKLRCTVKEGNIKNVTLIKQDTKIPLGNDSQDAVLCYDVIHYANTKEREEIYRQVHKVLKKNGLFSVYPKHHKRDYPLNELAGVDLEDIIKEIEEAGFFLEYKLSKKLLHDEYYNEGYILNFRKR